MNILVFTENFYNATIMLPAKLTPRFKMLTTISILSSWLGFRDDTIVSSRVDLTQQLYFQDGSSWLGLGSSGSTFHSGA